jgi:hypothetical protein
MKTSLKSRLNRAMASPKWWLLTLAVLAFGLFMAQRPSRRYPSPADPGMLLAKEEKTGVSPTGPTNDNPRVESPDPNAGDGPVAEDDKPSPRHSHRDYIQSDLPVKHRTRNDPPEPKNPTSRIQITKLEVVRILAGSDFGKAGDWVMIFTGLGFMDGEVAPIVHLGDGQILEEVFVDPDGDTLFAVLPQSLGQQLETMTLKEVSVQNPGGLNRDPRTWGRIAVDQAALLASLKTGVQTRFKHGPYFLERINVAVRGSISK